MSTAAMQARERRTRCREKAVELKGGKCSVCGYSRCIQALDFHHAIGTKKFEINARNLDKKSWPEVEAEIAKCILLCANCHRELEAWNQRCVASPAARK